MADIDLEKVFSNGHWAKTVETVAELMEELKRLPPDLPLRDDRGNAIDLVVFNRDSPTKHLGFEYGGSWDEGWE